MAPVSHQSTSVLLFNHHASARGRGKNLRDRLPLKVRIIPTVAGCSTVSRLSIRRALARDAAPVGVAACSVVFSMCKGEMCCKNLPGQ